MIRMRLAPIAVLTANSCCRAVPRASSRIETFAHPMASSNITAANTRYSVPPIERRTQSFNPSTRTRKTSGKSCGMYFANCSTSGCSAAPADALLTPGLRSKLIITVRPGSRISFSGR